MTASNINVRLTDELRNHLQQQVGDHGLYENVSEYIRDLIRRDLKNKQEAWEWLAKELAPAMLAPESDYVRVSAEDVIARNKKNLTRKY